MTENGIGSRADLAARRRDPLAPLAALVGGRHRPCCTRRPSGRRARRRAGRPCRRGSAAGAAAAPAWAARRRPRGGRSAPSKSNGSRPQERCTISTCSASRSNRSRRLSNGKPNARCSPSCQPAPIPSSTRPPETWSAVTTLRASTDGWRNVAGDTSVPSRSVVVSAASALIVLQASSDPLRRPPAQGHVVVGPEQGIEAGGLRGGGERAPLLPRDALLALDHQADAHVPDNRRMERRSEVRRDQRSRSRPRRADLGDLDSIPARMAFVTRPNGSSSTRRLARSSRQVANTRPSAIATGRMIPPPGATRLPCLGSSTECAGGPAEQPLVERRQQADTALACVARRIGRLGPRAADVGGRQARPAGEVLGRRGGVGGERSAAPARPRRRRGRASGPGRSGRRAPRGRGRRPRPARRRARRGGRRGSAPAPSARPARRGRAGARRARGG